MAESLHVLTDGNKYAMIGAEIMQIWREIMYREKTDSYIDSHKEEMLEDLKALVRIDSTRGEKKDGMPFGEGPARVLKAAEEMMAGYGFLTVNYDNYVVTGDFNRNEKQLDILAHLDVVPVTPDWTVTDPFNPVVKDGKIYGRGTADDKGPAIAALYAMRAIRESGIELKKNVRLILGSDEECGSGDLEYYYKREEEAPMSFTPDADFPLINIEKGRLAKTFTVFLGEERAEAGITAFHGGDKVNVVPASAWAVVRGMDRETVERAMKHTEEKYGSRIRFTAESQGEEIRITAKGVAAHGSTPELGANGVCGLLEVISGLPLPEGRTKEVFQGLCRLFPVGDSTGEALGVSMRDEISGHLSMNLGILNYDGKNLSGEFDSRVPICGNDENVTGVIREKLADLGIDMEEGTMIPVHHVPADSKLVKALLASYERYTGIKGEPQAIGGGTYVHELKRGVAFGCMDPAVDNHMHGDDEFMLVDVLVMSAKIFADAILRLCM